MAESSDRTWRFGSKAGGTRSPFRLSGLPPFKCTYPVNLTDMMDMAQSSQVGIPREDPDLTRATRTRAVREYEETIDELKKENLDLKVRLYLVENDLNRNNLNNRGPNENEEAAEVVISLTDETVALKTELSNKNQVLQDTLEKAQKYATDLKELQVKFVEQQRQLELYTELPSEQELALLKDQIDSLVSENDAKDREIEALKLQVDDLSSKHNALKDRNTRSSAAIQGLAKKYHLDLGGIPKDVRQYIQTAVQAAKDNNEDKMLVAVESLNTVLRNLIPTSDENSSKQISKENLKPKCFKKHEKVKDSNRHFTSRRDDEDSTSNSKFPNVRKQLFHLK